MLLSSALDRQRVRMYYRSGTSACCCIGMWQMLRIHSPGDSTFLREVTSCPPSWKCDVKSKIWLSQSMHKLCEEHSCQISFLSDLKRQSVIRFFDEVEKKNKMSSNMRSVPDPKTTDYHLSVKCTSHCHNTVDSLKITKFSTYQITKTTTCIWWVSLTTN